MLTPMDRAELNLERAAARRRDALQATEQATSHLASAISQARKAGVPITRIAALSGLSRQGVYDFLRRTD